MIPSEKDRAVFQRPAAEQIKKRGYAASRLFRERTAKPILQDGLVHTWRGDCGAQTHDHNHGEREQNPPAQFRYLDRI